MWDPVLGSQLVENCHDIVSFHLLTKLPIRLRCTSMRCSIGGAIPLGRELYYSGVVHNLAKRSPRQDDAHGWGLLSRFTITLLSFV